MGWFSNLFGGGGDLRQSLFDAAASGDRAKLGELCRGNRVGIIKDFQSWTRIPPEVQQDEQKMEWYANGLTGVASVFAEDLGFPGLMDGLKGTPESNPLDRFGSVLEQAQQMMGEGRFKEAAASLAAPMAGAQKLKGSGADQFLAVANGITAQCRFHGGEVESAVAPAEASAAAFEKMSEPQGLGTALTTLYEIQRWRGKGELAAAAADRLAKLDETWRKQAAIVRAGEPLVRVVVRVEERMFELGDAPAVTDGSAQFLFRRNRTTLGAADLKMQAAQGFAGEAKYDEALVAFREAAAIDVFDPHARYLEGLTLLHLAKYAEALAAYDATEKLAPGWYQVRADRWLTEQLAKGRIDAELMKTIMVLVDRPMMPEEKLQMAETALAKVELPVILLAKGQAMADLGQPADAAIALRKGLALDGDADVRTRILLTLGMVDEGNRKTHFAAAVKMGGNLIAAAQAAMMLR